jgi:DNA-directed RNA polymerase subunit RPC12/RpoP
MAESKDTRPCPLCGAPNSLITPGAHCQSCGGRMLESRRPSRHEEVVDRGYHQEGFSATWCGISLGVVGILTAAVVVGLPMVVSALDFEGSAGMMLVIPIWFVSGMLVGLISPGRTVLEPVVATFLVAMPTAFLLFNGQTVKVMPAFMYVLMSALGILFALIGSYVGERIQVGPSTASASD